MVLRSVRAVHICGLQIVSSKFGAVKTDDYERALPKFHSLLDGGGWIARGVGSWVTTGDGRLGVEIEGERLKLRVKG